MKKKNYEIQLFSWAIDRAIRVHEVNKTEATAESIAAFADTLCSLIMENIAEPEAPELSDMEKQHEENIKAETVQ